MVKYIVIFAILAALLFIIFWIFKFAAGRKFAFKVFRSCNTVVFGKKGSGKDLLFNAVIQARAEPFYSNMLYVIKGCQTREIKNFDTKPITFERLIEGNFKPQNKKNEEKRDFYITDGGIYLPSQYSHILDKYYPGLPVYYALSRHLTDSNIHINTQFLGRPWNKLREQADAYFKAVRTTKIFNLLITRYIYYERYESAMSNILPYQTGLLPSAQSRANAEMFAATYGDIRTIYICQKTKNIAYDSRYFHRVIYGKAAPCKQSEKFNKAYEELKAKEEITLDNAANNTVKTAENTTKKD